MQHEQVDGRRHELRKLLQRLARHWMNDWENADYPGTILPDLLSDPSKGDSTEKMAIERILAITNFDERRDLPQKLGEAYAMVKRGPELWASLREMIRHFQMERAEAFFQEHAEIFSRGTYETMRKERIAKRKDTIEWDLKNYRFGEAEQLMEESCKVLLPTEVNDMKRWFQSKATRFARIYLQQQIMPLLEQRNRAEACRLFAQIANFIGIDEHTSLEADYVAKQDENPPANIVPRVESSETAPRYNEIRKFVSQEEYAVASIQDEKRVEDQSKLSSERNSWMKYVLPKGETPESQRARDLRCEVGRRGIVHLVHFTQLENVLHIVERGLLPRAELEKEGVPYAWNDAKRLDNMLEASSLSISFPNYKMFYKYRSDDKDKQWVILLLDPSILWECHCFFYRTNAASLEMRSTELFKKRDLKEFKRLFEVFNNEPSRQRTGIPDYYTTDPQAEVLVRDRVPPSKIQALAVEDSETLYQLNSILPLSIHCVVREDLFKPRMDHKYWDKQNYGD